MRDAATTIGSDQSSTGQHSIGDEIRYRRSTMEQRTGSLVFDKHLDAKLAEAAERSDAQDRSQAS